MIKILKNAGWMKKTKTRRIKYECHKNSTSCKTSLYIISTNISYLLGTNIYVSLLTVIYTAVAVYRVLYPKMGKRLFRLIL